MAATTPTYDELSIRIQPDGDGYRTIASATDGSTASSAFAMPFSSVELDNFVLRVGRQRLPTRGYRSTQMEEAKRFGTGLFEALMVDEVRDLFRSTRATAESSRRGLRLTLCLTDSPQLMDVPWEFLYEQPRFLAQSIYSPVVRSLDLAEIPAPHPLELPLTVLGMVSSPQGVGALDVDREKEKLVSALDPLCHQGAVTIEWLESGTLRELDEAISRHHGINVFHYIGHGAFDPRTEGGILLLENDYGEPHEVSGEELGLVLQDERGLRLAVLNSCEGARSSYVDPFSGVASSLVRYGIPAVIGMQFEITDEAAIAFGSRLYAALAQGNPVDAALAQSRRAIFAAGNDIEFGTPVLFLRGADAQLFELIETPGLAEYVPPAEAQPPLATEPTNSPSEEWEVAPKPTSELLDAFFFWLPKPWRDRLGDMRWNPANMWARYSDAIARTPSASIGLVSLVVFIFGLTISLIFGHINDNGHRESPVGTALMFLGIVGLGWMAWRIVSNTLQRLRDWWTGNG